MSLKPTTTLHLDADTVALLTSVVEFASESDTFAPDDTALAALWNRLNQAAKRLAE